MKKNYEKELLLIGRKINQIRISKNLTQSSLSSLCDIDIRTIQRIEKGEFNMSLKILFAISDALDISPVLMLEKQ